MMIKNIALTLMIAGVLALVGCERDGPAENAGEAVDDAVGDVQDALSSDGPGETAGEEIDKALDDQ